MRETFGKASGMKFKSTLSGAIAASAAAVTVVIGGTGAGAAPVTTGYEFVGWAGGSLVRAANNTITSDLTAASSINNEALVSDSNDVAHVTVPNLLDTGEVHTRTASTAIPGGYQVTSVAETAGVSALGGLITADAIETTTIAKVVDGVGSASSSTRFVNAKVGTVHVPLNVRPNTIIRIANIATVALNYQLAFGQEGKGFAIGIGAYVSLLKPRGDNAIGAELAISPTTSQIGPTEVPPSGHFLYAKAYGTKVTANVGTLVGIHSDETAPITMAAAGTIDGRVDTSSTAEVNLNPLAHVGAVTDSVQGTNTAAAYDGRAGSRIAAINLLNGFIRADAVGCAARVNGAASATVPHVTGSATVLNLFINNKPITLNANPNSVINVLGVAKITINQQIRPTNRSMIVRALDIKLLAARSGFPAGAEIEVAVCRVAVS
ncbi:MAG: hypothetical protein QOH89_2258 [Pseudonocardiales bacterium]|nr:hypothetical protein [Pseudonocardiales bacterium]